MIVLDTSAAIEALRRTEEGAAIRHVLCNDEIIVSCDLLRVEVASVLRKFVLTGQISTREASEHLDEAISFVDTFHSIASLQTEVLAESIRLNRSVYDMFYFVLARRTQGTLFTTDMKLLKLSEQHGVPCMTLIDF